MELVARLFGEAWEHRRRRQRAVVAGLLLVVIAVVAGLLVGRGGSISAKGGLAAGYRSEPASRVLASHNVQLIGRRGSFERVGVTVVLRHPASSIVASVGGRAVVLRSAKINPRPLAGTGFAGELTSRMTSQIDEGSPASPGRAMTVRLRVTYPDGSRVAAEFQARFKHGLALT
jgi:hypothetical protein